MKMSELIKETRMVWSHKEPDELRVYARSRAHKIVITSFLTLSVVLLFSAVILLIFFPVTRFQYECMVLASLLLYLPVFISGSLYKDEIGGSLRTTGLFALFAQIPHTLLFDTIQLNPAFLLLVLALLSRFGVAYVPLLFLASWMTSLVWPLRTLMIEGQALEGNVLLLLLLLYPLLVTVLVKATLPKEQVQESTRLRITWPVLYQLVITAAMMWIYI